MSKKVKRYIELIIRISAAALTLPLSYIVPKDRKCILFHGSDIGRYNESTRYLFEYMSGLPDYKIIWMTSENVIIDYLTSQGLKCVKHRSLKGLIYYLRAGCVIGTGTNFPSLSFATGSKTLKVCIHHGSGPRTTNAVDGVLLKTQKKLIKILNKWDYFNFTTKYMSVTVGKLQFLLPNNKRIVLGYPRCDHLLNRVKCDEKLKNKIIVKHLIADVKKQDKIILYSPTWRFNDREMSFPIAFLQGFSIEELDLFLEKLNTYMIISTHPLMSAEYDLTTARRVKFLPADPLFDINLLLPEVNLLITDYSSIATDFLLMERPVIYVMPDYDTYINEVGLLDDLRQDNPGTVVFNFNELLTHMDKCLNNYMIIDNLRLKYLSKYYDVNNVNSCHNFQEFILSKLECKEF